MDAIRCKEWRMFPVTSKMGEEAGYLAFTIVGTDMFGALDLLMIP